jgi:hypothetical protein
MTPRNHPNAIRGREKLAMAATMRAAPAVGAPSLALALAIEEPAPARSGHPTGKRGVDDTVDDRETPGSVFEPLTTEFDFTLDAAASEHNAKCTRYCTLDGFWIGHVQAGREHGLVKPWASERVFCNPPFSGLMPWVQKAWDDPAELVCLLLPNNRAEQPFWQTWIEPYRDRAGTILTTRNLPKRRPFLHHGKEIGNRTSKSPPFGLVVVIWDRRGPRARTV